MGFTHYFDTKPELKAKQFKAFAKDAKKLLANPKVPLAYESDETSMLPSITDEEVRFNGMCEQGHETFLITRTTPVQDYQEDKKWAFSFCKTARKPYDLYVTACLLLAKKHFRKDIKVSSDGEEEDWKAGQNLVKEVLGYDIEIKLGD